MAADAPADAARRRIVAENDGVNVFAIMEDICDKLKILNYESGFCKSRDFRPLSRVYFAMSTKPSEQFPYFSSLVSWLLKEMRIAFTEWNEFEDPNSISNNILIELRKLGFVADFPPAKLRHGSGDAVCIVLNFLLDKVLQSKRFQVLSPQYESTNGNEAGALDADEAAAIGEELVAEEFEAEDDVDGTGAVMSGGKGYRESLKESLSVHNLADRAEAKVPEVKVDPKIWSMELEKVAPLLKIKMQPPAKEWRTHLEQSQKHEKLLKELFTGSKGSLSKIGADLSKTVERLSTKEQHINRQFEHLGGDFRAKQQHYDEVQARYKQLSASVAELTAELAQKTEAIETIKAQMNERSSSMTDTTPLKRLQSALTNLRQEVASMELRIGVVSQSLLAATLKQSAERHRTEASLPYAPSFESVNRSSAGMEMRSDSSNSLLRSESDLAAARRRRNAAESPDEDDEDRDDEEEQEDEEEEDEEEEEEEEEEDELAGRGHDYNRYEELLNDRNRGNRRR